MTFSKFGLSKYAVNHVFGSLNLNNFEIFRLSFEDIFLRTLDTYTKKNEPTLGSSGGGVHGKVCWLITYNINISMFLYTLIYGLGGILF